MTRWLGALAMTLVLSGACFGAGWDDYKPNSISGIEKQNSTLLIGKSSLAFLPGTPFETTAVYTGKMRKTSGEDRFFVEQWAKSHGMSPDPVVDMLGKEIQVEQAGKKHWLLIQGALVPPFNKEVRVGKRVDLYLVLAGAMDNRFVFFVNKYQARN